MYFGNQKFLVAGLSRSGEGCVNFLLRRGAKVYVYDDNLSGKTKDTLEKLQKSGAIGISAEKLNEAITFCDVLVLSPGIPIDNPIPVAFRKAGKAIIGEEELGALYLRASAVAVTGTNGKTTTIAMLDEVFKSCGKNCVPCGNYGTPLINVTENLGFDDYALIEISSFQLETLFSLRAHVSVVTNITEDHLNRHYNMENYIFLKSKLVRNLRESEYAVLNYDDERVREFANQTRAKVIWFSALGKVDGAYVDGGTLYYKGDAYFGIERMAVSGLHNIYNALATIAVSAVMGLDKAKTVEALCAFKGVKHRIQLIDEVDGVTYIDDSKGTNVDATLKAIQSASRDTVLLLGGKDKGYDYGPLFSALADSKVIHAIIYGENRMKMMNSAVSCGFFSFSLCCNFNTALRLSAYISKPGQSVLLSPASASFDEFSGYEERGEAFTRFVTDLKK
ncbi:MAG: UDP-N-acetylmuramoyl-L-alanine--D-glutamate ligase [Candidatus Coproplasma sp.]